jgi:hypothetical protein
MNMYKFIGYILDKEPDRVYMYNNLAYRDINYKQ